MSEAMHSALDDLVHPKDPPTPAPDADDGPIEPPANPPPLESDVTTQTETAPEAEAPEAADVGMGLV